MNKNSSEVTQYTGALKNKKFGRTMISAFPLKSTFSTGLGYSNKRRLQLNSLMHPVL